MEVAATGGSWLAANGLTWNENQSAGLPGDKYRTKLLDKGMSKTMAPVCRLHGHIWSCFRKMEVAAADSDRLAANGLHGL
jgi:hypothetical protein